MFYFLQHGTTVYMPLEPLVSNEKSVAGFHDDFATAE
jgi:hypothetical protein